MEDERNKGKLKRRGIENYKKVGNDKRKELLFLVRNFCKVRSMRKNIF
jgi:hypothetical protein